jgi:hypothetical protein
MKAFVARELFGGMGIHKALKQSLLYLLFWLKPAISS